VELYLHPPYVFMAWCVVERKDDFILGFAFTLHAQNVKMSS